MDEKELTAEICAAWIGARPGCNAAQANALYGGAKVAAQAMIQAEKDEDAQEKLAKAKDKAKK